MAVRRSKKLRLTTNTIERNGQSEQRSQRDPISSNKEQQTSSQVPSKERQPRNPRDQVPSNERPPRNPRDQVPSNERPPRNPRDPTSSNNRPQPRHRDQTTQRDQNLSEATQPRNQRDQVTSNERQLRNPRDQVPANGRQRRSPRHRRNPSEQGQQRNQRDQDSSNLGEEEGGVSSQSHGSDDRNTYEYTVEDSNGNRRRGKTVLADVWNLPAGQQIVVEVNKENQPIGEEGGVLGYFCGTVARNGSLCSLTYTRWDLLKKGCNRNNQKLILEEVERRFLYPKSLEKWILTSIGHKWRDFKCYLKGKGYDDDTDINTLYDNCPDPDVQYDQWVSLVNFWRSDEGKKRSKRSKESHSKAKVKPISTTGTKSHARVREDLRKKLKKSPTRTETYLECHQHETEADITNQIKNIATEQGDQEVDLDDDPVSKVLGKDQYGRVRGLGLGVKPSDVGDPSYPRFCKRLKMSADNEVAVLHYFHRLKEQMQRVTNRLKRQGNTIAKMKRKLQDHSISISDDSESEESASDDSLRSEYDGYESEEEYDNADDQDDEGSPRPNYDNSHLA